MDGLDLANRLFGATTRDALLERLRTEQEALRAGADVAARRPAPAAPRRVAARSAVSRDVAVPAPPDLELHVLRNVPLGHVYPYLNLQMLLGKHLGVKGSVGAAARRRATPRTLEISEAVEELKREAVEQGLIRADGLYRFYEARPPGDDLMLFAARRARSRAFTSRARPAASGSASPTTSARPRAARPTTSRSSPSRAARACASWPSAGRTRATTSDRTRCRRSPSSARRPSPRCCTRGCARSGASRIRPACRSRTSSRRHYRGIRVSFGYPACPELADQRILFDLLRPEQIGLQLTEGFMMDPEASVSALVFHHPEAKYFKAG